MNINLSIGEQIPDIINGLSDIKRRLNLASDNNYGQTLRDLLEFINGTNCVKRYVDDCGAPAINSETELTESQRITNENIREYSFGRTEEEEVANIMSVLRGIVNNNINVQDVFRNDTIRNINRKMFFILIAHILRYIRTHRNDLGFIL